MPKRIQLPDGSIFETLDTLTDEQALAKARAQYPDAFAGEAPAPRTGFFPGLIAGAKQAGSQLGTFGLTALGKEDLARKGYEADVLKQQQEYRPTSYEDVEKAFEGGTGAGISSLLGFWRDQVAQSLPQMAGYVGAARLGAMAGGAAAPLLGPAAPAAPLIGGALGAGAFGLSQFTGENLQRQLQEQQRAGVQAPLELGPAVAAAVPQTALDVGAGFGVLRGFGFGKTLTEGVGKAMSNMGFSDTIIARLAAVNTKEAADVVLKDAAKRSLHASIARGSGIGVAVEVPTEVAQQILGRAQAGLSLTDPSAWREYKETAVGTVGPGGVFGAVGGVHGRFRAQEAVGQAEAAQAVKAAQEQEARKQATLAQEQATQGPQLPAAPLFAEQPQPYAPTPVPPPQEELREEAEALPRNYEVLKRETERLQEAASTAQDPAEAAKLADQHVNFDAALNKMRQRMGEFEQAGVTLTPLDRQVQNQDRLVKKLQAQREKAQSQGDTPRIRAIGAAEAAAKQKLATLRQSLPDAGVQPDLFAEAERVERRGTEYEAEQEQLKKEQDARSKQLSRMVSRWTTGLEEAETQRQTEAEAAAQRQAERDRLAQFVEQETTAPIYRPVKAPAEPGEVVAGRVRGRGYSYPTGVPAPAEEAAPGKVAKPRYLRLTQAVDEGRVNNELIQALGLNLKEEANITTPQGAVAALPAIEARINDVRRVLEEVDPDTLTPADAARAVKVDQVLRELRRLRDTANTTLREQPAGGIPVVTRRTGAEQVLGIDRDAPRAEQQRALAAAQREHETAFEDFVEVVDDIRKGVYFGGPNLGGAVGTLRGLQNRASQLISNYTDAMLRDVGIQRVMQGKPALTTEEALATTVGKRSVRQKLQGILSNTLNLAGKIKHDQYQLRKLRQRLAKARYLGQTQNVNALIKRINEIQTQLERRFPRPALRKEGELKRGVDPLEAAGWRDSLEDIRRRLLAVKTPMLRAPMGPLDLRPQTAGTLAARQARMEAVPEPRQMEFTTRAGVSAVSTLRGRVEPEAAPVTPAQPVEFTTRAGKQAVSTLAPTERIEQAERLQFKERQFGKQRELLRPSRKQYESLVKRLQNAAAKRKAAQPSVDKLVTELEAQLAEQPKNVETALTNLLEKMYPVRTALLQQLRHEAPFSVTERLRKQIAQFTGPITPTEEFEGVGVQEAQALAADAARIEEVYRRPVEKYKQALRAAQNRFNNERLYLETLRKELPKIRTEVENQRVLNRHKAAIRAERQLREEQNAASKLSDQLQQKVNERFGLLTVQRTIEPVERTNPLTGERVVAKEKGTGEPILRKTVRVLRPEAPAAERAKAQAEKASEERMARQYRQKQTRWDVFTEKLDALKAVTKRVGPLPGVANRIKALTAERTKLEAEMSALHEKLPADVTLPRTPLTPAQRAANIRAKTEAIKTLRSYGDIPAQRRPSPPKMLTGTTGTIAEAKAVQKETARTRREDKRRQRMEEAETGPTEERGLETWDIKDTGITVSRDNDDGTVFHSKATPTTGVRVNSKDARALVELTKENLPENMRANVQYYDTLAEAPADFQAKAKQQLPEGQSPMGAVMPDGRVILVGEMHDNLPELSQTISHELFHYGPDVILGKKGFAELSDNVWRNDEAGVRDLADALGVGHKIDGILTGDRALQDWIKANPGKNLKHAPEAARLAITRELVADTGTYNPPKGKPLHPLIQRFIKWIVSALRKYFPAINKKATTQEIYDVLRRSVQAYRSGRIGEYRSPATETAFKSTVAKGWGSGPDNIIGSVSNWQTVKEAKRSALGLWIQVQAFDHAAALSKAVRTKLAADGLDPDNYIGAQMMTHIRAHQDDAHHTSNVLSKGGQGFVAEQRGVDKDGKPIYHYTWGGARFGPGMDYVVEPFKTVDPDPEAAEKAATFYGLLRRAERVGDERINLEILTDPAEFAKFQTDKEHFKNWLKANPQKEAALKLWFDRYQEFNAGLLDMLAATGAVPKAEAARLKALKDYIPMYRINPGDKNQLDILVDEGWKRFSDITHQPGLHQLLGGKQQIMPFFTSAVRNTHLLVNKALTNQATKSVAFTFKELGLLEKHSPNDSGIYNGYGPSKANVIRFNVEPNRADDDGKRHAFIDTEATGVPTDLVMHGLRGTSMQLPAWMRVLTGPSNIVRSMVVRNPMFAVRQLYSDLPSLLFTSGAHAHLIKGAKDLVSAITTVATGREPTNLSIPRLQSMGLLGGNLYTGTMADYERMSRQLAGGRTSWHRFLARLDRNGVMADAFSRAYLFDSLKSQGMSEMEAGLATREALDFSRHGVSPGLRMVTSVVPFMNTQMQSLYAIAKAMTGKMPYNQRLKLQQKFWARGALLTTATLAYASMMQDDEAYRRATPAERYYYWFVRIPGLDEPLRIRIPFEAGVMFKAFPEALYQLATTDATLGEVAKGLGRVAWNSNPFAYPPLAKAAIEQSLNVSTYTGTRLEESRLQRMDPFMRYRQSTSETSKALGKMFNISPARLDNLIQTFGTGTGMALFTMFDPLVRAMQTEVAGEVAKTPSKWPLIGTTFQTNEGVGLVNAAYDMSRELRQRANTFNELVKQGRAEQAQAYAAKYLREIGVGKAGSIAPAFESRMIALKRREQMVLEAPESKISPERKRELLKQLRDAESQLAASVRATYIRAGI